MTATVRYPVRFARSTPESLNALFKAVQDNPQDESLSQALANELESVGRGHEAHYLREHPDRTMIHKGKVVLYAPQWYAGMHLDDAEDYEAHAQQLREHGPEAVITDLSSWIDLGDYRHQAELDGPSWGSEDETYGPSHVTWQHRDGRQIQQGNFHLYHNPRLGYIGFDYEHHNPVPLPDPSHTEFLEDGGRGPYKQVKAFADAEVGVPHSLVPFGGDWVIHTAPYGSLKPKKVKRAKYARSTPESINALFTALIKNPTDQSLRLATANELEAQGQHEDAALLRQSIEDKARAIRSTPVRGRDNAINSLSQSDKGHLQAALWSSIDDNGEPLDSNYFMADIHPDTMASMLDDWHRFRAQHRHMIEAGRSAEGDPSPEENAAHDFWLSRNGHGAGFFDTPGQYGGNHDRLHAAAKQYGEFHLQGPEPEGVAFDHETGQWDDEDDLPGLDDDNFDDRYGLDPPDRTITGTSYVNTDNEGPQRMSRIRYAQERQRPTPEQEEAAFLDAISKNPEDTALHHAYANLLGEQGRHGEAAFHQLYTKAGYTNSNKMYHNPVDHRKLKSHAVTTPKIGGMGWVSRVQPHREGNLHFVMGARPWGELEPVLKLLHSQKILRPDRTLEDGRVHSSLDFMNYDEPEEPVRHAAYRAPKGGAVVRGSYYVGGRLIPDLEGDFANPPAPEQPVTTPQYPQPPRPSLRERLKSKLGKKAPLVVSYARATPESLRALFDAVRRDDVVNPDLSIRTALANELRGIKRDKEADLLDTGRFAVDLNGGGKIVKPPARRLNTATRRGFAGAAGNAGVTHQDLFNQLQAGRSNRIGNNRTIEAGPNGDVHVLLHGNHVVTAHPNGEYSLFTQGWHTPTTFAVHQEITGHSPNRVRGQTMFRGQPFEEGIRFNPNE